MTVSIYLMLTSVPGSVYATPQTLKELLGVNGEAISLTRQQSSFWFYLNVGLQTLSVILGIIATLMMALQNNDNAYWMKPIGIIATTLTTGIVTAYSAFHITDNIDTLLKVQYELAKTGTDLEMFMRDNSNPDKTLETNKMREFSQKLNDLGNQRRQVMGSIGSIQIKPSK
jgi:hypothetical protein